MSDYVSDFSDWFFFCFYDIWCQTVLRCIPQAGVVLSLGSKQLLVGLCSVSHLSWYPAAWKLDCCLTHPWARLCWASHFPFRHTLLILNLLLASFVRLLCSECLSSWLVFIWVLFSLWTFASWWYQHLPFHLADSSATSDLLADAWPSLPPLH